MRGRSLAIAAALIGAAARAVAAGNSAAAEEVHVLLAKARFTPQQGEAVRAALQRAERGSLPLEALTNRLREGIARRAEPRAILGVIEDRLAQLEKADDIVRRAARQGLVVRERERALVRLADAFATGVRPGDVLDLLASARGTGIEIDRLARGAEVLGRLERKGFPADETRDVVGAAVAAAWSAEQMDEIVGFYLEADVLHLSAGETKELLVEGIREKKAGQRLADGLRRAADAGRAAKSGSRGLEKGAPAERRGGGRTAGDNERRPD